MHTSSFCCVAGEALPLPEAGLAVAIDGIDRGETLIAWRLEAEALREATRLAGLSASRDGTTTGALTLGLLYLVTNGWLKNELNSILSLAFLFNSLQQDRQYKRR